MANPPFGLDFIEGSLGVVLLTFDGIDLGKTIDEATLEFIEDIKDIMFAQNGTQPYDKVPTGQAYQLTVKIGEITWNRLEKVLRGLTVSGSGHSALLGRDIYTSGRTNFAKQLIVTRVDSDGVRSADPLYRLVFWLAMPTVNGPIGSFGPDTQREVEVIFYIFYDETNGGFGYSGYATSVGV
jgi:hypothetical protein